MTPTGSKYGAAISRKDYVRVSAAAGIGSVLECELPKALGTGAVN